MSVWDPPGRRWSVRARRGSTAIPPRPPPQASVVPEQRAHPGPDIRRVFGVALLGAAGVVVTLALTHATVGYGVDSSAYLGVAHNLVTGRGPTVPMTFYTDHYPPARAFGFHGAVPSTHFPPLYPAVLALFESFGMSAAAAVRTSSTLIHALNLVLVALLLSRVLLRRAWIGALGGAAVLLTVDAWLITHAFAMSEALFITTLLAFMLAVSRHLVTGSRHTLVLAASLAAAAMLTRWVGLSVGVAGAGLILTRQGWSLRTRLERAAAVMGATATAGFGWALFGRIAGGSSPRLFAYHPPQRFFGPLLDVLSAWFVRSEPWAGAVLGVIFALGILSAATRRPRLRPTGDSADEEPERIWLLRGCVLFAAAYVIVVYAARTYFDASIPTSDAKSLLAAFEAPRIYVPLLPILLIVALATIEWIGTSLLRTPRLALAAFVVPLACLVFATVPPSHLTAAYHDASLLVDATRSRPSPAVRAIRLLPRDATIATNFPSSVYAGAGRPCLMVPLRRLPVTGEDNPGYRREVAEMTAVLLQHHGYLALYPSAIGSSTTIDTIEFARWAHLVPVAASPDGIIFRVDPKTS